MAIWCTSAVRDDGAAFSDPRPPKTLACRAQAQGQAAIEALILVVEGNGPTMLARIGVMRALHRHDVRQFNPDAKEHHWGKRKLKGAPF
jgi:hypothetical protein